MISIKELTDRFPNVPYVRSYELVQRGFITQQHFDNFYAIKNYSLDYIYTIDDDVLIKLLENKMVTAIVQAAEVCPNIPGNFSFIVQVSDDFPNGDSIAIYVPKQFLPIILFEGLANRTNIAKNLSMISTLDQFENIYFENKEWQIAYEACLKAKRNFLLEYTAGFLSNAYKPVVGKPALPVPFLHDTLTEYLGYKDLCNLRLVCKR